MEYRTAVEVVLVQFLGKRLLFQKCDRCILCCFVLVLVHKIKTLYWYVRTTLQYTHVRTDMYAGMLLFCLSACPGPVVSGGGGGSEEEREREVSSQARLSMFYVNEWVSHSCFPVGICCRTILLCVVVPYHETHTRHPTMNFTRDKRPTPF